MQVRAAVAHKAKQPLSIATVELDGPKVGASMIVGVDVNPAREALARKLGMTHFVNPKTVEGDLVAWYMSGKPNVDDLITHTMPLDKINEAFRLMHEGKSIRGVVMF